MLVRASLGNNRSFDASGFEILCTLKDELRWFGAYGTPGCPCQMKNQSHDRAIAKTQPGERS